MTAPGEVNPYRLTDAAYFGNKKVDRVANDGGVILRDDERSTIHINSDLSWGATVAGTSVPGTNFSALLDLLDALVEEENALEVVAAIQCYRCKRTDTTTTTSEVDSRRAFREEGWRTFAGQNLCPECGHTSPYHVRVTAPVTTVNPNRKDN